jgi:hypothetical protein
MNGAGFPGLGEGDGSEKEDEGQNRQKLVLHENLLSISGDVAEDRTGFEGFPDLTSLKWADLDLFIEPNTDKKTSNIGANTDGRR